MCECHPPEDGKTGDEWQCPECGSLFTALTPDDEDWDDGVEWHRTFDDD